MSEQKLEIHKDCTLNEAVAIAHKVRESYHCTVSPSLTDASLR